MSLEILLIDLKQENTHWFDRTYDNLGKNDISVGTHDLRYTVLD